MRVLTYAETLDPVLARGVATIVPQSDFAMLIVDFLLEGTKSVLRRPKTTRRRTNKLCNS